MPQPASSRKGVLERVLSAGSGRAARRGRNGSTPRRQCLPAALGLLHDPAAALRLAAARANRTPRWPGDDGSRDPVLYRRDSRGALPCHRAALQRAREQGRSHAIDQLGHDVLRRHVDRLLTFVSQLQPGADTRCGDVFPVGGRLQPDDHRPVLVVRERPLHARPRETPLRHRRIRRLGRRDRRSAHREQLDHSRWASCR